MIKMIELKDIRAYIGKKVTLLDRHWNFRFNFVLDIKPKRKDICGTELTYDSVQPNALAPEYLLEDYGEEWLLWEEINNDTKQ